MLKTTTILIIPLMFAWRVWGRYNFYRLRRSIGRGKLGNILESKNQYSTTRGPDIFSENAVQTILAHQSIVESQVAREWWQWAPRVIAA